MSAVVVLDFDGTLYKKNSFPLWVMYCLRRALRELRLPLLLRLISYLFLRKFFFLYGHNEFKEKINNIKYPQCWAKDFCSDLVVDYNEIVLSELKMLSCSCIMISTAAPECYARCIIPVDGFLLNYIICSENKDGVFMDNSGQKKMERTIAYIDEIGLSQSPLIFFTDNFIDSPLARISSRVFLCEPNDKDINRYRSEGIEFTVLRGG